MYQNHEKHYLPVKESRLLLNTPQESGYGKKDQFQPWTFSELRNFMDISHQKNCSRSCRKMFITNCYRIDLADLGRTSTVTNKI